MKIVLLNLAACTIILFSCATQDKETVKREIEKQTYQQQKESLLEKEKKHAKDFLELTGEDNRNFWGQSVYRGKVKNNATQCSYKNIRIKTLYYKKDGSLVTNHEDEFEEIIKPGKTFEFKTKYKTPGGTDSVRASIIKAEVSQ